MSIHRCPDLLEFTSILKNCISLNESLPLTVSTLVIAISMTKKHLISLDTFLTFEQKELLKFLKLSDFDPCKRHLPLLKVSEIDQKKVIDFIWRYGGDVDVDGISWVEQQSEQVNEIRSWDFGNINAKVKQFEDEWDQSRMYFGRRYQEACDEIETDDF
jgi:hypothetical protein